MSSARTIFITGAGTGIGAATARLFACAGWRVAGSALHAEHLATVQADLGERFVPFVTDVRDRRGMCDAVADFAGRHGAGKLDAVFANAGVLWMGPDERLTPEQKQALIDVNASGLVHTFDAALPFLRRAAPGAHAVAMASTSAEYGSPHHALYSATKFFVRGYTEALAIEHRRSGIQVSGIYVSYVNTGMVTGANFRPRSIDVLGVKATPGQVAKTVWRAVHGRRTHWRVGFDAKLTHYGVRLLGPWAAPIYARLTGV
jgi:NADP-dependent 3-hydroxy acid dehydrogenase YdfG